MIIDYVSKESHSCRERSGINRRMGQARVRFRPADWFGFFAEHGWSVREMRYVPVEGARPGRRPPLPRWIMVITRLLGRLAPKEKRHALEKFAGYAILTPTSP